MTAYYNFVHFFITMFFAKILIKYVCMYVDCASIIFSIIRLSRRNFPLLSTTFHFVLLASIGAQFVIR